MNAIALRRFGWGSLLVAFIFLGVTIMLVKIIKHFTAAGGLTSLVQEGLTIPGGPHCGDPAS